MRRPCRRATGSTRSCCSRAAGLKRLYGITLTLALLLALLSALAARVPAVRAPVRAAQRARRGHARGGAGRLQPARGGASRDELGMLTRSFNSMTCSSPKRAPRPSARKRELAHAKAYLESILANLSAGVLAFDENLRLRSANRSADEILRRRSARRSSGASSARGTRSIRRSRALARRRSRQRSHAAAATNGSSRSSATRATARRCCCCAARACRRARETGYVVVFDDITHLLQAQRDAAWAEVARRLAHEIKNPLTPIQLSAERAAAQARAASSPSADAEMLTRSTQTIVNQVAALKSMVDAFSQYARTPEPAHARARSERARARGADALRVARLEHRSSSSRDELPRVVGDAAQLRQVMHNLLQNAQDALADSARPAHRDRTRSRGRRACASPSPTTAAGFPST